MRTCIICGEEYNSGRGLHWHMRSHTHDHVIPTELQRQVILGSLLGDMSISARSKKHNPYIQVGHTTKQTEYLMWKFNILKSLTTGREPSVSSWYQTDLGYKSGKKIYNSIHFQTRSLRCLVPIYDMVRSNGNKHVSTKWLNEIKDPIGIAVWYMDDGCLLSKFNAVFALGLRSPGEQFAIQDWMMATWDIETHIYTQTNTKYKILSISSKSNLRKFRDLVEPYIIPSMRYKIDKLNYLYHLGTG